MGYASVTSGDSHVLVKVWIFVWVLVSDMSLVGLVKQDLLGDVTKLELLEPNNGLKLVSEQFEVVQVTHGHQLTWMQARFRDEILGMTWFQVKKILGIVGVDNED
ncbi:hypothetical protein L195_g036198 [Trifolium pratense]|uniref:Uncharacterized protein n=1 Tax=Trifolium pratense TaxID=57577 RepID=A0A2K3LNT5_TRIPR|nr:hypothetical protein L195_g036198 [Trifolium pratense]